jgi:hypothetical protein
MTDETDRIMPIIVHCPADKAEEISKMLAPLAGDCGVLVIPDEMTAERRVPWGDCWGRTLAGDEAPITELFRDCTGNIWATVSDRGSRRSRLIPASDGKVEVLR